MTNANNRSNQYLLTNSVALCATAPVPMRLYLVIALLLGILTMQPINKNLDKKELLRYGLMSALLSEKYRSAYGPCEDCTVPKMSLQ